jgi:hypothetical protein
MDEPHVDWGVLTISNQITRMLSNRCRRREEALPEKGLSLRVNPSGTGPGKKKKGSQEAIARGFD